MSKCNVFHRARSGFATAVQRSRALQTLLGLALLPLFLPGCVGPPPSPPDTRPLEFGRLPPPDTTLDIPGLGPCTDNPDRSLRLSSQDPVTVLVHGCRDSAGRFRSLAQVYAFHGQQTACFSYDDRDSLNNIADDLATALDRLSGQLHNRQLDVIGHSMGGLVARKALTQTHQATGATDDVEHRLLTIATPFAGIGIAAHCGSSVAHWASLGLVPAICRFISGDNWYEITAASDFIRRPGPMAPSVRSFVKIVTDERDSCRQRDAGGACIQPDFVFSLDEQYNPAVDASPQVTNIEVAAGHVEIVGEKDVAPHKLIQILQQRGLLAVTPVSQRAALSRLLARLY